MQRSIQASGTRGDRHAHRYFNTKVRSQATYELSKSCGPFAPGHSIRVTSDPIKIDSTWHVTVLHEEDYHNIPISKIKPPFEAKNVEEAEDAQISSLHDQIQEHLRIHSSTHVDIYMPDGRVVRDVVGAFKVGQPKGEKEKPKADLVLRNIMGEDVHFTSLKKGASPKDFQQYGGVSHMTDHPLIRQFAEKVNSIHSAHGRLNTALQMYLDVENNPEHQGIQKHSMFGIYSHKFPSGHILAHNSDGSYGIHNVHDLIAGQIRVSSREDESRGDKAPSLDLTASHHVSNSESFRPEDHPIVLGASHRDGRMFNGVRNVRAGIYPAGWRSSAVTVQ